MLPEMKSVVALRCKIDNEVWFTMQNIFKHFG